jgi:hypothetical protein
VPVIVAGPLMGPHLVVTVNSSSPFTVESCASTSRDATHGRSSLFAVPEIPVYLAHGADGRNTAHDSCGWEVVVDLGAELVDVGDFSETGAAVSGPPPVFVSPQDVNSMPANRRGTVYCHNRCRLRCISVPPSAAKKAKQVPSAFHPPLCL